MTGCRWRQAARLIATGGVLQLGGCASGAAPPATPASVPAATPAPAPSPVSATPLDASSQLILVITPGWSATKGILRRYERSVGTAWRQVSDVVPVVIGRTGLAWGDDSLAGPEPAPIKREGDGKSPAGVFALDTIFGFAPASATGGLGLPYVELLPGTECVDDPASRFYNTVVDRSRVSLVDWNSAEPMRRIDQYRLGVIVGYNATPPRRGRGSCIFLHIWGGPRSVTSGCTAMDADVLGTLVRWLDGRRHPKIVQLTETEYDRRRAAWALP